MFTVARMIGHRHAASSPVRSEAEPVVATALWADTLTRLVRSHRARLAAPDPSRSWLEARTPPTADQGDRR
jgi:hypothetical protein